MSIRIAARHRSSLLPAVVDAARDALAVVLPVDCLVCGADGRSLCAACEGAILASRTVARVEPPHGSPLARAPVVAAADYAGVVRSAMLAFKRDDRVDAARVLSVLLSDAIDRCATYIDVPPGSTVDAPAADAPTAGPPDGSIPGPAAGCSGAGAPRVIEFVCPPSRAAARRRRGFAPVPLLLRRCGARDAGVLGAARRIDDQIGLGRAERSQNLAHSFEARRPLRGRRFVIVDDVYTTGSTVDEAARAILAAGGEVCGAAVVAVTRSWRGSPGVEQLAPGELRVNRR